MKTGLEALLDQRGISQSEFARLTGQKRQRIHNWVHGHREPNLESLSLIAQVLGVTLDDLVARDDSS